LSAQLNFAIEATLANKPVVARPVITLDFLLLINWIKHFRAILLNGPGPLLKEDPDVLIEDIIRIYREWDENRITEIQKLLEKG
jgi:hypothetical protein